MSAKRESFLRQTAFRAETPHCVCEPAADRLNCLLPHGSSIERAVTKSLTQPRRGDEVVLQRTGRDAVTVQRQEKEEDGTIQARPVDVYRN